MHISQAANGCVLQVHGLLQEIAEKNREEALTAEAANAELNSEEAASQQKQSLQAK